MKKVFETCPTCGHSKPRPGMILHPETIQLMLNQVEWYRSNGHHQDRIKWNERWGCYYVIGDFSWNRHHPDRQEVIEVRMDESTL